ncbi:MAG: YveK family protein [Ardenticatenaceae bacterium]
MQAQQILNILKDDWWVIVAICLIFSGIGMFYSYSQTPVYEVSATFALTPNSKNLPETYDLLDSFDTLASRSTVVESYSHILESDIIIGAGAELLGLPASRIEGYEVNSVVLPDSFILSLNVRGTSALLASDLANAIGTASSDYLNSSQEIYVLQRLDMATVPNDPISPNHALNMTLSVLVGIIGGFGFLVLRHNLTQTFKKEQDPAPDLLITTPLHSKVYIPES